MKSSLFLFVTVATAAAVTAQNRVGYDVDNQSFASRGNVAAVNNVDILHHVVDSTLVGVGNAAGGEIAGIRFLMQDQDLATREAFNIVFYPDDGTGNPQLGAETRSSSFALAAGTGGGAFFISLNWATPVTTPATNFFYGVGLAGNAAWPVTDGLSLQGSNYNQATRVSNPNAPRVALTVDTTNATIPAKLNATYRMDMLTSGPTLVPGADIVSVGQVFGMAGHWQNRVNGDGIAFRVRDAASANLSYAILGQIGGAATPTPLAFVNGLVYLNPALLFPSLLGAGVLDANGAATTVFVAAPLTLPAPFGQVSAQALIDFQLVNGNARLSNLAVIQDS